MRFSRCRRHSFGVVLVTGLGLGRLDAGIFGCMIDVAAMHRLIHRLVVEGLLVPRRLDSLVLVMRVPRMVHQAMFVLIF
jgi:hypothetical protein